MNEIHPTDAPNKRKRPGNDKGGRGSGFGQAELDSLLDLLDEALPLCAAEWDAVVRDHQLRYPGAGRTVDSLKRKFSNLHRKKMPTGDPLMPADVRKAKHIRYKMTERSDLGDGNEDMVMIRTMKPMTEHAGALRDFNRHPNR